MNHRDSQRLCARFLGRVFGVALLVAAPGLLIASCGGLTPDDVRVSGESHFLRSCASICEGGFDCINGLCTRGCLVGEAGDQSCRELAATAACTSESVEPGSVAVCDAACRTDAECTTLSEEHTCVEGFCRSVQASTLACSSYRNNPGNDRVTITVRNERESAVFLTPFVRDCNDEPHLIRATRNGREAILNYPHFCGGYFCEQIQESASNNDPCPASCTSATLVRLDPGSELEAGAFASEFVSHGRFPGTAQMPAECVPGRGGPIECVSEVPLIPSSYEFTAQAFSDCNAEGVGGSCDCETPLEQGACTTGASYTDYEPIRGGLTATTTVELPTGTVTLVFQ